MSARIAPEPISVAVTMAAAYQTRATRTTRPVEPVAATGADRQQGGETANRDRRADAEGLKPEPGIRPPGKDPSVPPQSLFDAALIASEFKATLKTATVEADKPADPKASNDGNPTKDGHVATAETAARSDAIPPDPRTGDTGDSPSAETRLEGTDGHTR